MNNKDFEPRVSELRDEPVPAGLHAKIMKRVFITTYGRYLYLSAAVLFVNLTVLSVELYRKLLEIDASALAKSLNQGVAFSSEYLASSISVLYHALPIQSMAATSLTAALCAYMAYIFVKFHRDPQSISIFRKLIAS